LTLWIRIHIEIFLGLDPGFGSISGSEFNESGSETLISSWNFLVIFLGQYFTKTYMTKILQLLSRVSDLDSLNSDPDTDKNPAKISIWIRIQRVN